jgi:hypothetical protein
LADPPSVVDAALGVALDLDLVFFFFLERLIRGLADQIREEQRVLDYCVGGGSFRLVNARTWGSQ